MSVNADDALDREKNGYARSVANYIDSDKENREMRDYVVLRSG